MATYSSILAWKIPWSEGPDRLQSMGDKESDTTKQLQFHFFHSKGAESHVLLWSRTPGVWGWLPKVPS